MISLAFPFTSFFLLFCFLGFYSMFYVVSFPDFPISLPLFSIAIHFLYSFITLFLRSLRLLYSPFRYIIHLSLTIYSFHHFLFFVISAKLWNILESLPSLFFLFSFYFSSFWFSTMLFLFLSLFQYFSPLFYRFLCFLLSSPFLFSLCKFCILSSYVYLYFRFIPNSSSSFLLHVSLCHFFSFCLFTLLSLRYLPFIVDSLFPHPRRSLFLICSFSLLNCAGMTFQFPNLQTFQGEAKLMHCSFVISVSEVIDGSTKIATGENHNKMKQKSMKWVQCLNTIWY